MEIANLCIYTATRLKISEEYQTEGGDVCTHFSALLFTRYHEESLSEASNGIVVRRAKITRM